MKFLILGSKIDNLVNAYFLAKDGHDITIIEDKNIKSEIDNDLIFFYNHPTIFDQNNSNKNSKNFLSNIKSFFYKKIHDNHQINDLIIENQKAFEHFLDIEKINLKNQENKILYLYRNPKKYQQIIEKVQNKTNIKNYKIFDDIGVEKINSDLKSNISNSILLKNSFTIDRKNFVESLQEICKKKYRVKFEKDLEIHNILTNHKKITGINTDKKVFVADYYLVNINDYNISFLNGIDLKIKLENSYKLNIFTDLKNIRNSKINYNIKDLCRKTSYYKNSNHYKIEIDLGREKYENLNNEDYFHKINQLDLLNIIDYKKIKCHIIKEQSIANHNPIIEKSKKYHNLLLNGAFGEFNFNLSFGAARILQKTI
jgi:hypothetical protein